MAPSTVSKRGLFAALSILVCLMALGVFFRDFLGSGFNLVAGDNGDSRFDIAILEHWRAVGQGHAEFTSPNFYWPQRGVLGYSDSLFLLALPYDVFRSLGIDPYLSFEWVLIGLKTLGFFSMLWVLRSLLGISRSLSLLGAALFTVSNLYYISVWHSQLMAVVFVPLFYGLILCYREAEILGRTTRAGVYAAAAASLLALLLFTSLYIGWFTVLCGSAFLLVMGVAQVLKAGGLAPAREWVQAIKVRWGRLVAGLATFALVLIPFVVTYLPVLKLSGGRRFEEVMRFSAEPIDVINVGGTNWMWGKVVPAALASLNIRYGADEKEAGWPLLMLLVFMAATVASVVRVRRSHAAKMDVRLDSRPFLMAVLGVTCVVLWLLSVKFGQFSLWWLVFKFVPGGAGIRVPARLHLVLNIGVITVVVMAIEQVAGRSGNRARGAFVVLISAVLLAEQVNVGHCHQLRRDEENAILARIRPAPAGCRAFLATTPATAARPFYAHQIDAMFAARMLNLPTINGYSGWQPPGWDFFFVDGDYLNRAQHWAMEKDVTEGLCGCDLRTGAWSNLDLTQTLAYSPGTVLDFHSGGNARRYEAQGWGVPEAGGTWTVGDRSVLLLHLDPQQGRDIAMNVELHAFTPPQRRRFTDSVYVNQTKLADWEITGDSAMRKQVRIPRGLLSSSLTRVEFQNHDPRSPAELGYSADPRKVGLALERIVLESADGGGGAAGPGMAASYELGTTIDFHAGGNAKRFEAKGWDMAEPGGTWMVGDRSTLVLRFDAMPKTDLLVDVEMHAFTPSQRPQFTDSVSVNGTKLSEWAITAGETAIRRQIRIPRRLLMSPAVQVAFRNHDPRSPVELGYSNDPRRLGLAVHTMVLKAASEQ